MNATQSMMIAICTGALSLAGCGSKKQLTTEECRAAEKAFLGGYQKVPDPERRAEIEKALGAPHFEEPGLVGWNCWEPQDKKCRRVDISPVDGSKIMGITWGDATPDKCGK